MYNEYFDLDHDPFSVTPDPDFFFYADQYKEAMAHLLYGIQERRGLLLVTGRVGSGKTTLCRSLAREFDQKTRTSFLQGSFDSSKEILIALARDFDLDVSENFSREKLYSRLEEFLLDDYEQGYNACLIVDESQNLSVEVLEQLRLLSNLETDKNKLLQIVLVGQPELETLLNEPELRQLKQRISIRTYLSNLDAEETREYVEHRLYRAARGTPAVSVESNVYRLLYEASEGNPRVINRLADRMLLAAYVDESDTVGQKHLNTALDDLSSEASEMDERDGLFLRKMKIWFESSGGLLDQLGKKTTVRLGIVALTALLTVLGGMVMFGGWYGSWLNPTILAPDSTDLSRNLTADKDVRGKSGQIEFNPSFPSSMELPRKEQRSDTIKQKQDDFVRKQTESEALTNSDSNREETVEQALPDRSGDTDQAGIQDPGDTSLKRSKIPNPFSLEPIEEERFEKDTSALTLLRSFNRYISYKSSKKRIDYNRTLSLSDTDSPVQSIRNRLPSDSPSIQLVEVEGTYSKLRDLTYPFFPLTVDKPKRYLLSLPESEKVWDPLSGWLPSEEAGVGSDWEGTGYVLAPAPFDLSRLRSFEDTGASVVRLQELLNGTGHYDLPLVGNYGPLTQQRIRDFQRRNDLLADGVGGPWTYLTLLKENNVELHWTEERIQRFLE